MSFSEPKQIVAGLGISAGEKVADFGTGSGAYTLALARVVGSEGRVYAIDIQKDLLSRLAREANSQGIHNIIEVVWGDLERNYGTQLADKTVDLVVIANLLFQLPAKYILAREARRILKDGGRLAVIDWKESFGGLGPRPDEVVSPDEVKKVFTTAGGFRFVKDFPAGDHHYGLLFDLPL